MITIGIYTFSSGDKVTCRINNHIIEDARIYIHPTHTVRAWICHNIDAHKGDDSPDKLGYKYSWCFYTNEAVSDVTNVVPLYPSIPAKIGVEIDKELIHFFNVNNILHLMNIFHYKVGLFEEFTTYAISDNLGHIQLKSDKKTVEIKLSRFTRQLTNKFNSFIENLSASGNIPNSESYKKIEVLDKEIEDIHNKYLAYQQDEKRNVVLVSGQDILEGYRKANYGERESGTLHKSCMVDHESYLKLYTENPNQVQLAIIRCDGKVAGRCIVWTATDGKKYSDRVYYNQDWIECLMTEKLRKIGINPIYEFGIKVVQLDKWDFPEYPYVDNFYYFDKSVGTLVTLQGDKIKHLRNTNGQL